MLTGSAAFGTLGMQLAASQPDTAFERLGTAGALAVGAWLMLKYFMAQLSKKDELIERMHRESTDMLVKELKSNAEVKENLTTALRDLTDAVRGRG